MKSIRSIAQRLESLVRVVRKRMRRGADRVVVVEVDRPLSVARTDPMVPGARQHVLHHRQIVEVVGDVIEQSLDEARRDPGTAQLDGLDDRLFALLTSQLGHEVLSPTHGLRQTAEVGAELAVNLADVVRSLSAFGRDLVARPPMSELIEPSEPSQVMEPKEVTSDCVVMTGLSTDSSSGPDALFASGPDDDVDRNLRASTRKPGLLAVVGLRVPAKPLWIGGIFLLGAIAVLAWDAVSQPPTPNEAPLSTVQSATINSRPEGVAVSVDGMIRGTTPLKLTLPVGEHLLKVQNGEDSRSIPISLQPGPAVSQFIDFGVDQSAQLAGALDVTSNPAKVRIDGAAKGKTPLAVSDLSVGEHTVGIDTGDAPFERKIRVAQGATTSVFVSQKAGAAAPSFGWLSIASPVELQVVENGHVIGTTSADRVMVLAGRHEFELQNSTLEFRSSIAVKVPAGKVVTKSVTVPNGSLSLNALPWADVLLDGQAVGETPLANIPVALGQHEIVWRHPQLGNRRQSVLVTAGGPVRVGVDLRK